MGNFPSKPPPFFVKPIQLIRAACSLAGAPPAWHQKQAEDKAVAQQGLCIQYAA